MGMVAGLVVATIAVLAAWSTLPAAVSEENSPGEFSSVRAMADLERFATEPRLPGTAAHTEAREFLLSELGRLGWRTEVHSSVGLYSEARTVPMAAVTNIVATLPGTAPTGTVLVAAHYDSVPGSPGAGDDGIGVATALETARVLAAGDERPRNDVMLLITDAEEFGLLGAEAFIHDHADDLGPAVVVNLEARGNEGRPISIRLTQPNSVLLDLLAETPTPVVDSFSDALFAMLDNDTDLTRFTEGGLAGFDTAIAGGGAYYHTPLDDPGRLREASLQQMGAGTLAFVRAAGAADLVRVAEGREEIAISHPWGFLRHPQGWELPLAIGSVIIAVAAAGVARVRRQITLPRTLLATIAALLTLPLAVLVTVGVWAAALAVDPGQASAVIDEPYVPWPYRVACMAAVVGVVALLRALLCRVLPGLTFAIGALLALAGLGLTLALPSIGLSSPVVFAVLPAALATLVAGLWAADRPVVRTVVHTVGVLPAGILLGPAVLDAFDVGLGEGGLLAALFLALLVLLTLAPVDAPAHAPAKRPRGAAGLVRRLRVPLILLLVVALGFGAGLLLNREGATDPRQEMVAYSLDADTGEAVWSSGSPSGSAWARELMADPRDSLSHLPWLGGGDLANGPAPGAPLEAPEIQVITDHTVDGRRELTLDLSSQRGAPGIGMWLAPEARLLAATVAGREVPLRTSPAQAGTRSFGFLLRGAEAPIRVRLVLTSTEDPLLVQIADLTHDLGVVPEFTQPPRGRVLVTPEVYVHRTVEL